MIHSGKKHIAILLATGMLVAGCGGGGGSGSASSQTFTGTITGFGSVFVNGIEFDTSSTSISVDESNSDENGLKVGMMVTVTGTANGSTGTATSISFNDEVEGIVIANNISSGQTTGTMDIMGQTVTISSTSIFESKLPTVTDVSQITTGMIVEVSGYSAGTGSITATRIEVKSADLTSYLSAHPGGIEVKGMVSQLDTQAMTFQIGNMIVDYSGASLDGFSAGIQNSIYVEVKSVSGIVNGNLVATKVEVEDGGKKGHTGSENEESELKGAITSDFNVDRFELNGQVILVSNTTKLEHITLAQLTSGTIVKVEGYYNKNGELVAKEVEVKNASSQKIKGTVSAITTTATNQGTITVGSNTITVDNNTIMKDSRDNGVTPDPKFNLSALGVGDYVEVYVYTDSQGNLVATKIERDDASVSP